MRILMVGDVVGKPGRHALSELLPGVRESNSVDLVVANGENAAGGIGLTPATAEGMFSAGVDVITSGNHIWHHKEITPYLEDELRIVRPLNMPPGVPGHGYVIAHRAMIVNLLGRVFVGHYDCPFRGMDQLLEDVADRPSIILVDFHAEATAEKEALGWYLDGRVTAVVGTHTHVGTVDTRVLPRGTAYVTDIGMVGAMDSVIGDDIDGVLHRFLTMMPHRLSVGAGDCIFNSVLIEAENDTGKATGIRRIDLELATHEG